MCVCAAAGGLDDLSFWMCDYEQSVARGPDWSPSLMSNNATLIKRGVSRTRAEVGWWQLALCKQLVAFSQ